MKLLEKDKNAISFTVSKEGLNIEEFLKGKGLSGRFFRKLYKEKKIFINGDVASKRDILKERDLISILFQEEINNIEPEKMNLDIVYEDSDILVINKEANIVVHPTKSHQSNTLSNGIAYYYKLNEINRKIRFVNRLDMNTSGLLIVAKHAFAHQQIASQFEKNTVEKKYYAIVKGRLEKDQSIIDKPIGREEEKSIRKKVIEDGKRAITSYKVIERYANSSLLEIQLFTGRSHQIRIHLNYIGHPIIGDSFYYKKSEHIERQALHSYFLGINNIRDGRRLEMKSSLPQDMKKLLEILRNE